MSNWLLPSLSDIFRRAEEQRSGSAAEPPEELAEVTTVHSPQAASTSPAQLQLQAEFEWRAALDAVQRLLRDSLTKPSTAMSQTATSQTATSQAATSQAATSQTAMSQGVVLCGPLPVISDAALSDRLMSWIFVSDTLNAPLGLSLQLNPQGEDHTGFTATPVTSVPVLDKDPLASEQFCLVLTAEFGVVLVLGQEEQPRFQFSFDPRVIQMCWQALLLRVRLGNASYATKLHRLFEIFPPSEPDYHLVSQFSRYWGQHLAQQFTQNYLELASDVRSAAARPPAQPSTQATAQAIAEEHVAEDAEDVTLLKAIAHEVRTPLATIRTLTRLLLRRKDLAPDVLKRLGVIDNECTEQIDRFSLIFKAAEMGPKPQVGNSFLASIPLEQVVQEGLPRWQKQAERRNLELAVNLPEQLPRVVSDPQMLDQALTGLIDRFTRQLPSQSRLALEVSLAGNQLKLQFQAHDSSGHPITATITDGTCPGQVPSKSPIQSLGQLLSFQPATGSLSLNMAVTKNIFQALGGKLLIKERPQQGEVVTVFLPLQADPASSFQPSAASAGLLRSR